MPTRSVIMKDFMANGRFSRGIEVIADASLAFVGNIDMSVEHGFITDYLAEAFHYLFQHTNRYEEVTKRIRLGSAVEGRDEKGIKKTMAAFLKILHPAGSPTESEFEEYVVYAVECRRRVKEQMNKRKPDDEFARINLSYFKANCEEVTVFCPESKNALATPEPTRRVLDEDTKPKRSKASRKSVQPSTTDTQHSNLKENKPIDQVPLPQEQHFTIYYGDTGYSYQVEVESLRLLAGG